MEDCISSDEDYYDSDRESLHGLENEDSEIQWIPKSSATKVFYFSRRVRVGRWIVIGFDYCSLWIEI